MIIHISMSLRVQIQFSKGKTKMKSYDYKVCFYRNTSRQFRYVRVILVEANSNKEAAIIGRKQFEEERKNNERLKNIEVVKETCRAIETKPRARKLTPIERALNAVNQYLLENK